jgi:hypothetical protein
VQDQEYFLMTATINVLPMEVARKPPRAKSPKTPARAEKRAMAKASAKEIQAQMWSAGALGGIAAVITGLSLSHLAHGITIVSGTGGWQSWAMALGIDLGMVTTEIATLTAGECVRRETQWYSAAMIAGTLVLSAAMNAFGFASQASTLPFQIAGVVFGVAVPAAIYVLMRQAAAHYLDAHKRS